MSEGLTFGIYADASDFFGEIARVKAAQDKLVAEWAENRRKLIAGIREGYRMVASLISSYRQAISLFGGTIDPLFDAMLTMLTATVSLMMAIAAAYTSTIVLSPLGAVVGGIAIGLSIVSYAKMMQSQAEIIATLTKLDREMPQTHGVGVGF